MKCGVCLEKWKDGQQKSKKCVLSSQCGKMDDFYQYSIHVFCDINKDFEIALDGYVELSNALE